MLNPDTNAGSGVYLEKRKGKRKHNFQEKLKNCGNEKMKNMKREKKGKTASSKGYPPRRLQFFFGENVLRNRGAIEPKKKKTDFEHPRKEQ